MGAIKEPNCYAVRMSISTFTYEQAQHVCKPFGEKSRVSVGFVQRLKGVEMFSAMKKNKVATKEVRCVHIKQTNNLLH